MRRKFGCTSIPIQSNVASIGSTPIRRVNSNVFTPSISINASTNGRFRQELFRTEVTDREGMYLGRALGDVDPVRFRAGIHIVAARVGIGVAVYRVLAGEQALVGQPGEPGAVLPVGVQVGNAVGLLDLDGGHLLQKSQRIRVGVLRERHAVDDVAAQGFFAF